MDYYGVIGNPIMHSKSPAIHQRFAQLSHQELFYDRIEFPVGEFDSKLRALLSDYPDSKLHDVIESSHDKEHRVLKGCNVTIPFKQDAFEFATEHSERAFLAQACNTLKFENGKVIADNTDGLGLVRDIQVNAKFSIQGKKILLLGAGGAAAGALGPLIEAGPALITIANRTLFKAEQLCASHAQLAQANSVQLQSCSFDKVGRAYDLLINATASSLSGAAVPVSGHVLSPQALGYDMMYGPNAKPFLDWVKLHGGVPRDGLGMLVEQAAEAFFIWRGIRPESARVLLEMRQKV